MYTPIFHEVDNGTPGDRYSIDLRTLDLNRPEHRAVLYLASTAISEKRDLTAEDVAAASSMEECFDSEGPKPWRDLVSGIAKTQDPEGDAEFLVDIHRGEAKKEAEAAQPPLDDEQILMSGVFSVQNGPFCPVCRCFELVDFSGQKVPYKFIGLDSAEWECRRAVDFTASSVCQCSEVVQVSIHVEPGLNGKAVVSFDNARSAEDNSQGKGVMRFLPNHRRY